MSPEEQKIRLLFNVVLVVIGVCGALVAAGFFLGLGFQMAIRSIP